MCVQVCVSVCLLAFSCMYVCMYACMYVCIFVSVCVCIFVHLCVCVWEVRIETRFEINFRPPETPQFKLCVRVWFLWLWGCFVVEHIEENRGRVKEIHVCGRVTFLHWHDHDDYINSEPHSHTHKLTNTTHTHSKTKLDEPMNSCRMNPLIVLLCCVMVNQLNQRGICSERCQ